MCKEPLAASVLTSVFPQEQKQMSGEQRFPLIQATHPTLAGRITGMLLEVDNSDHEKKLMLYWRKKNLNVKKI